MLFRSVCTVSVREGQVTAILDESSSLEKLKWQVCEESDLRGHQHLYSLYHNGERLSEERLLRDLDESVLSALELKRDRIVKSTIAKHTKSPDQFLFGALEMPVFDKHSTAPLDSKTFKIVAVDETKTRLIDRLFYLSPDGNEGKR